MNILVISNQNNNEWSGPTYSIPKQVSALSKVDNVFWYNLNYDRNIEWEKTACYYNLDDYPLKKISALPDPFHTPDIVIVEQFYPYGKIRIFDELIRCKIPYIIVPRGELTKEAQQRKFLKKAIANYFMFYKYSQNAKAIMYLTKNEKIQSGLKWNKRGVVVSNGIDIPLEYRRFDADKQDIRCISIGRISPYQKGLDLLIQAGVLCKKAIIKNHVHLDIYGPDYDNAVSTLQEEIKKKGLSKYIQFHDGIFGDEKIEKIINSDIFLMTSRFEGHPMALIEALSYGLPCIATDGSNMRSEIDKYAAGWTSNNTVEGIKSSILRMIDSKKKFNQYGMNARQLAIQYNWDRIAKKTHKVLLKLLGD